MKTILSKLGTSTGQGCGKVPQSNCQACISARAYLEVPSCGLFPRGIYHKRKFTGKALRYCSQCPFPDGCIVCDMP